LLPNHERKGQSMLRGGEGVRKEERCFRDLFLSFRRERRGRKNKEHEPEVENPTWTRGEKKGGGRKGATGIHLHSTLSREGGGGERARLAQESKSLTLRGKKNEAVGPFPNTITII